MYGITMAPDFDRAGLQWFNVANPLMLTDLRGRMVILDFFTSCCINCMHALPVLRRVEERFDRQVAVIGVHSPKFPAERRDDAIARAIARYGIRHPVIHDPHMLLWDEYRIRAWPTLVFISPDGHIVGRLAGEPHPDMLPEGIGRMLREFWRRGEIQPGGLPLAIAPPPAGRLLFPGKIKRVPDIHGSALWAVADAGHHQIALFDDGGRETARFGRGVAGFDDGAADAACFNGPQGLIADAEAIFVADTGNHAIRRIDRLTGAVTTLAGTGVRGLALTRPTPASTTALASPWDLELVGGRLYFANAGSHQIGCLELAGAMVWPAAGSGDEGIVDGAAARAELAQPSGLAASADGRSLYFADSEVSAVRILGLDGAARVTTLVGAGLFEWGHVNGGLAEARLQHPLGLAVLGDRVVVADSYNDALRVVDPQARQVTDLHGMTCEDARCLPFSEPAGIAADGPNRLLLADTNNHRIVEFRLDEGRYRTWSA